MRKDASVKPWRCWLWAAYLLFWSVIVQTPVPPAEELPFGEFIEPRKFVVAKSIHVASYALLTVLSGWLFVPTRWRWLLMFVVMGHGAAMELLQAALVDMCHREGTLRDVGFNCLGVLVGVALSWKWWSREDETGSGRAENPLPDASEPAGSPPLSEERG